MMGIAAWGPRTLRRWRSRRDVLAAGEPRDPPRFAFAHGGKTARSSLGSRHL